jgi:hypothetical protein
MLNEKHPVFVNNNVYYHGAQPFKQEVSQLSNQKHDPDINISVNDNDIYLEMTLDDAIKEFKVPLITTDSLGKTIMVGQRFEDPLGADLTLDEDYFGNPRNSQSPMVGPFEKPGIGKLEIKVW